MKTKFFALFIVSFLACNITGYCTAKDDAPSGVLPESVESQALQIISTPDLNDLAKTWIAGYCNLHPGQKIELTSQTETNSLKDGYLYLVGNKNVQGFDLSAWKLIIGHEPVVAVINSKNPFAEQISKKGFTAEMFAKVIAGDQNWSTIVNEASNVPAVSYISDNQEVITRLSGFTKIRPEEIPSSKVIELDELVSLVQKNENAIGFCMLTDVMNPEKNGYAGQISIVPVDKNKNGRIDDFENIYASPEKLTRGAWIGKYPRNLCGEIYVMASSKPTNQSALDFMTYITADGQVLIKNSGYSILSSAEKTANLLALGNRVQPSDNGTKPVTSHLGLLIMISSLVLILAALVILIRKRRNQPGIDSDDIEITPAMNENTILAPKGLYYDKTHTWAFMELDGLVKIGIDDFLKHVTGQITQLKMKEPGEKVRKGEKILTIIRNGKHLNLYSPVSGFIRKQNGLLSSAPSKINNLPFTDAWIYQIEPNNWKRESGFMFMFDKYREWLDDEFIRLKDFLAFSANSNTLVYQHIVLQDGGELKDHVLADLGPEVWEDFQTKFIDLSK